MLHKFACESKSSEKSNIANWSKFPSKTCHHGELNTFHHFAAPPHARSKQFLSFQRSSLELTSAPLADFTWAWVVVILQCQHLKFEAKNCFMSCFYSIYILNWRKTVQLGTLGTEWQLQIWQRWMIECLALACRLEIILDKCSFAAKPMLPIFSISRRFIAVGTVKLSWLRLYERSSIQSWLMPMSSMCLAKLLLQVV